MVTIFEIRIVVGVASCYNEEGKNIYTRMDTIAMYAHLEMQ